MKKTLLTLAYITLYIISSNAQIIITELMYNSPDVDDLYEYIELYNSSESTIQLKGYKFIDGIDHTFQDLEIASKAYLVLVKDSTAIRDLNISAIVWDNGGLKNKGETIILADSNGITIDSVDYSDRGEWVSTPDGDGPSLELCDYTKDNSKAEFWKASILSTGLNIEDKDMFGTPGEANSVSCVDSNADYLITLNGTSFSPNDLTVYIGETVQWKNTGGTHNVNGSLTTFPNNPEGFYSGDASDENWTYEFTFNKTGEYNYQCDPHADLGMKGKITVIEKDKPELVITEILYNDNGIQDSLEFVEIFNAGEDTVFLNNFHLKSKSLDFIFPNYYLKSNHYLVVCKNPNKFKEYMGYEPFSWGLGGLNNKTDSIVLTDDNNAIIDIVQYSDSGDWDVKADGAGYSLALCDHNTDNNDGNNWQACPVPMGLNYEGVDIHATPGRTNYCDFDVSFLKEIDSIGILKKVDIKAYIEGTVYGTNYNPEGLQFVIKDYSGDGIWTYSGKKSFGYEFHEGDKVELWGKTSQYNGLAQIKLDSLILIEKDSILDAPSVVTDLNENTEGELVIIKNVKLLDYTKWGKHGSGFNVKVASETDTFDIRIDKDVDLFEMPHPVGVFDIIGLGGQYDKSKPYLSGYQLFPRSSEDISPYISEKYLYKRIKEVSQTNDEGTGQSVGEFCELRGLVYGTNLKPSGLQFTIIDEFKDGIGVYHKTGNLEYNVKEGDYISIKGQISQFNGLLQIVADSVILINQDNPLFIYDLVTELNEKTESQLVKIKNLTIKDLTEWKGNGSSFNVIVTNGTDDFTMRIDNDIDLSNMIAPNYKFNLIGIGGQYDNTAPYLEGYQILPRYSADIEKVTGTLEYENNYIALYPNPVSEILNIYLIDESIISISIYNNLGQKIINQNQKSSIDVSSLHSGYYKILIKTNKRSVVKSFVKR